MKVANERRARTQVQQGPRGDSQAHGRAERAVRTIEETTRVQVLDLENRTGQPVDPTGHLFGWLVKHACDLTNTRMAGRDGQTPWERLRGRPYRGQLLRFGTPVLHRLSGPTIGGVLMTRWAPGHWLGKTSSSDEHLVVLPNGHVIRARSVRAVDESIRWTELKRVIPVHPGQHTTGSSQH